MQASTERACLRRLSFWVYSTSKLHALFRSSMVLSLFSPVFLRFIWILYPVSSHYYVDNIGNHTAFLVSQSCSMFWSSPLWQLLKPNYGHHAGARGFTGSTTLRPLRTRTIPYPKQSLPPLPSFAR